MHAKKISAIAAVAALFLFAATPAKAGIVEFHVNPFLSSMTVGQTIDATLIAGGFHVLVPQVAGSDTASLFGNMYVDLGVGTSIEFLGGGTITVANTDGGAGYAPFDPVVSDPLFPPVGVTTPANYGLKTPAGNPLNLVQVQHQLIGTLVGPARPIVGTHFNFVPGLDFYLGTGGRTAFSQFLGTDSSSLVGFPLAVMGTAGISPGVWDPLDTTAGPLGTLTIPIESSFTIGLDMFPVPAGDDVFVTFTASGVIVATVPISEPSSMVLLGFGVVGLLSCGWRLRRRRF